MPEALLDTSVFIDHWLGDTSAKSLIDKVTQGQMDGYISTLSLLELWQHSGMSRQEEVFYQAILMFIKDLPVTNDIAIKAGLSIANFTRSQRRRYMADAVIAKTADVAQLTIFSRNWRDMSLFSKNVARY